ncbi:hypothetical protein [uncultured Leifsonia sp.]|uniref:hypothetical protein n=1 Tax=uncultured Leifsonia sp. TaxID=340359 RepID=UPI0028D4F4FA|nr:hypothetical protein [uncultured Leifsonia sp.]
MSANRTVRRNATAAVLLLAALSITGCAATSAVAAPRTPAAAPAPGAEPAWVGSPSPSLQAAERVVGAATLGHDDVFAGTAYAHDYSTLTVYATDLHSPAVTALTAALRGQPAAGQVRLQEVEHSMAELNAAAATIDVHAIAGWSSVGPDVEGNRLRLGRDDTAGAGPAVGTTIPLSQLTAAHAAGASDILVDVVRETGDVSAAPAPAVGR